MVFYQQNAGIRWLHKPYITSKRSPSRVGPHPSLQGSLAEAWATRRRRQGGGLVVGMESDGAKKLWVSLFMGAKQCHKPPMTGNCLFNSYHTTYLWWNWGSFIIVLLTLSVFRGKKGATKSFPTRYIYIYICMYTCLPHGYLTHMWRNIFGLLLQGSICWYQFYWLVVRDMLIFPSWDGDPNWRFFQAVALTTPETAKQWLFLQGVKPPTYLPRVFQY